MCALRSLLCAHLPSGMKSTVGRNNFFFSKDVFFQQTSVCSSLHVDMNTCFFRENRIGSSLFSPLEMFDCSSLWTHPCQTLTPRMLLGSLATCRSGEWPLRHRKLPGCCMDLLHHLPGCSVLRHISYSEDVTIPHARDAHTPRAGPKGSDHLRSDSEWYQSID